MNIVESSNYLLYNDTKRFIETRILPLKQTCPECETVLALDFVTDLRYDSISFEAETRALKNISAAERKEYDSNLSLYRYQASSGKKERRGLVYTCMVCNQTQPLIAGDLEGRAIIEQYYKEDLSVDNTKNVHRSFPGWIRQYNKIDRFVGFVVSIEKYTRGLAYFITILFFWFLIAALI